MKISGTLIFSGVVMLLGSGFGEFRWDQVAIGAIVFIGGIILRIVESLAQKEKE